MKVILVVIDGLSYNLMNTFLPKLPNFQKLATEGVYSSLESTYPSITPVALASLFTGLLPKNNGITSPKIFVKGRKLSSPLLAHSSYSLIAEPIWAILADKKIKVLVTSAPQALPDKWKLDNLVLFDPYKSKIRKFSKGMLLTEGENSIIGNKWVVKKEGDNYHISLPGTLVSEIKLKINEWSGPIEFIGKIKDNEIKGVTFLHARENDIYMTPPSFLTNWGNKRDILENVWNLVALKFGMILDGDYKSLSSGIISFEEYLKTAELAFNFFYHYTEFLLRSLDWDFAITYLPTVDNFQHLLYGVEDNNAENYIFRAYEYADKFVELISRFATTLFVCSDHGISKVKKRVYINKILEKINVLKLNEEGKIDWKKTKAYYAGGGIIRINLRGREENGIVKLEEFPKLVKYIVRNLENFTDNGERIFVKIYQRETPAGDREGDIEIGVSELYSMSSDVDHSSEIEDVIPYRTITADHGYYRKDDLYGVFFAYGRGIQKNRKISAKIVDITPTILKMFNIELKKTDGRIIIEMLKNEPQDLK